MKRVVLCLIFTGLLSGMFATIYAQDEAKDSLSFTRLGIMKVRGNDYEGGIKLLDKAVNIDKENNLAYYWRGKAKTNMGDYIGAIKDFDVAIKLRPDYAPVYMDRANTKRKLGDEVGAKQDIDTAVKLDPSYLELPKEIKIVKQPPEPQKPEKKEGGEVAKASEKLPEAEKKDDLSQKAKEPSLDQLAKVVVLSEKEIAAVKYFQAGKIKLSERRYELARWCFNEATRLNPSYAEAYFKLGIANGKLNHPYTSISDFDKAIKLAPAYAEAYVGRGDSYVELYENEKAIADYDKAIELNPKFSEAYYGRGNANRLPYPKDAIVDWEKAIELWEKIIELNPSSKDQIQEQINVARNMQNLTKKYTAPR